MRSPEEEGRAQTSTKQDSRAQNVDGFDDPVSVHSPPRRPAYDCAQHEAQLLRAFVPSGEMPLSYRPDSVFHMAGGQAFQVRIQTQASRPSTHAGVRAHA